MGITEAENIFIDDHSVLDPSFISVTPSGSWVNLIDVLDKNKQELLLGLQTETVFNGISKKFPLVTIELLKNALIFVTSRYLPELYPYEILDEWKKTISDLRKKLKAKRDLLLRNTHDLHTINTYIVTDNGNSYSITSLDVILRLKNVDIDAIIKEYPVDNFVPFLAKSDVKAKPVIKYFKENTCVDKWILEFTEKKQKRSKLSFKIKEYLTGNYIDGYIIDSVLNIKFVYNKDSFVTFDIVKSIILKTLQPLVKNDMIHPVIASDLLFRSTVIGLDIKRVYTYKLLKYVIKDKFSGLLEIQPKKIKNVLTLMYSGYKIIINNKTPGLVTTKATVYADQGIIKEIINILVSVYIEIEKNKALLVYEPVKKIKNDVKHIKVLRNKGVSVNSVGCQKRRQPVIASSNGSLHTLTDPKTGIVFTCNQDYIYPGFTNNNIICCFKKDQRDKLVYLRNLGALKDELVFEKDKDILKRPIIVTDKILEYNRVSAIPKELKYLFKFPDLQFRLGNVQSLNSIVHALEIIQGKQMNTNVIASKLTSKIYKSLDNGDLYAKMSQSDYSTYILNQNVMKRNDVLDFYAKCLNLQIVLVNVHSIEYINFLPNSTGKIAVILEKKTTSISYYEVIVEINNDKISRYHDIKTMNLSLASHYTALQILSTQVKIKSQYLNPFNKVTFVNSNYGILPVEASGLLLEFPVTTTVNWNIDALLQLNLIGELYEKTKNLQFKVTSQILNQAGHTIGLVNKFGVIIPVSESSRLQLPVSETEYYSVSDLDKHLKNPENYKSKISLYNAEIYAYKKLEQKIRYILSRDRDGLAQESDTTRLHELIRSKLKNFVQVTSGAIHNSKKLAVPKDIYDLIVNKISRDILDLNKTGKLILQGKTKNELVDKNSFVKRKNEKILLSG